MKSTCSTIPATVLLFLLSGTILAGNPIEYGAGLGDAETVAIASLLASPQDFVGKTVRVEGKITDVCPKAGCWIDIEGDGGPIRFKVKDGEIVFDRDTVDRPVAAVGVFTRIDLTREQAVGYFRHIAEEKGEAFDESTVDGAMAIYRIEGTGAVVY